MTVLVMADNERGNESSEIFPSISRALRPVLELNSFSVEIANVRIFHDGYHCISGYGKPREKAISGTIDHLLMAFCHPPSIVNPPD